LGGATVVAVVAGGVVAEVAVVGGGGGVLATDLVRPLPPQALSASTTASVAAPRASLLTTPSWMEGVRKRVRNR
jgi:hypothetical protein